MENKDYSQEIWKEIPGYNGKYFISNHGRILSKRQNAEKKTKWLIILKSGSCKGYEIVGLCLNGKTNTTPVHRLVAKAFIPNPLNKREVNHLDRNKANNHVSNLEWATRQENVTHAHQTYTCKNRGEDCGKSKLKEIDIPTIRQLKSGMTFNQIALKFNVDISTIMDVVARRTWKHVA